MTSVVLLGKGDLAVRIAEWFVVSPDHELACVVPVIPEPTWTASLATWAKDQGVPIAEKPDPETVRLAAPDMTLDLAFSCFYDRILKPPFLDAFGRSLNLHNGPLPRYRGVSPINWALKNGERQHGVTIHEITPSIDDGPIVAQVTFTIDPDIDEVVDVYRRALAFGWTLFEQTMPQLGSIVPTPQDEAAALIYRRNQDHLLGDRRGFTRAESSALDEHS